MAIISNGTTVASGGNLQAPRLTGNLPALNASSLTDVPAGVSNINTVVITSSGTYTPTSGTKFFKVYCTGGGGSGSNAPNDNDLCSRQGGSGGGGGTAIRTYNATEMGATASVTIGSGGAGTGGNKYQAQQGNAGSASSFNPVGTGATITGNGGSGGRCWMPGNNGVNMLGIGGKGGTASGGQLNVTGGTGFIANEKGLGQVDSTNVGIGMTGGASYWYAMQYQELSSRASVTGTAGSYGSGGNGGLCYTDNGTANGGAGGSGVVVIEEYA